MGLIEIIIVLAEGILSFFSPCIIPVLPVYLALLSTSETESKPFLKSAFLKNTIAFVLGISTAFILLGVSFQTLSVILYNYQSLITLMGGALIIVMGLFYLGYLKIPFLNKESRFHIDYFQMNIITAYVLGFTFSFGWTPCIGPMLASVLMMSVGKSLTLILVYTLGFIIPFLIVALSYRRLVHVLNWVKQHINKIKVIGGIVLVLSGGYMVATSFINLNEETVLPPSTEDSNKYSKYIDFELVDQSGTLHQLSQYEGKFIYLTFWTTWCPNCTAELPYLDQLYKEYGENQEEVVILTVAAPNVGREGDEDHIKAFIQENGYTLPVLMDEGGYISSVYNVQAVPTSFVITKDGDVLGYIPGRVGEENLRALFEDLK